MKPRVLAIALAILICIFIVPCCLHAAPVGEITRLLGSVDITRPGMEAQSANTGNPLSVGDIIRVKSKSKCEVSFLDGNVVRLASMTRLRITEYAVGDGGRREILDLYRGKIQNVVKTTMAVTGSRQDGRYEVQTPTAVVGVRGTEFFAYYIEGIAGATFKEGTGYGYSKNLPEKIVAIQAGQTMVVVNANEPPILRPAVEGEMNRHERDTDPAVASAVGAPAPEPLLIEPDEGTAEGILKGREIVPAPTKDQTPYIPPPLPPVPHTEPGYPHP